MFYWSIANSNNILLILIFRMYGAESDQHAIASSICHQFVIK